MTPYLTPPPTFAVELSRRVWDAVARAIGLAMRAPAAEGDREPLVQALGAIRSALPVEDGEGPEDVG